LWGVASLAIKRGRGTRPSFSGGQGREKEGQVGTIPEKRKREGAMKMQILLQRKKSSFSGKRRDVTWKERKEKHVPNNSERKEGNGR